MKNSQQVMFVETQGDALSRLRLELTAARPDWHILLVVDAPAGVELLAQRKIGLVLANFGTDKSGCEDFFRTLKQAAPDVIRMGLLPDQCNDTLANSLEYAHQCVAAHCGASELEVLINRGLSVWQKMQRSPRLAELLSNLQNLPTPPALYFDIRDELESPSGTARSVAQIIARDPAITAKLLKVANSGFFATPRTIADLFEAINLLGIDLVLALVLAAHLYDQLPLPGLNLDVLWKHSMAVANLAKAIAAEEGASRATVSTCAIAGLLHDVGQLVFLTNVPDPYFSLVRRSGGSEELLLQMELEQFGVGHPELGAVILSLWGLPDDVVQAVAGHHVDYLDALAELPLPSKAVSVAEWLLDNPNLKAVAEVPADSESMAQWQRILHELSEQGLIQQQTDNVAALFG